MMVEENTVKVLTDEDVGVVVEEEENPDDEILELLKFKVKSLIEDWKERDYPKGRGLQVTVKTTKPNHADVWGEQHVYKEGVMEVFFIAEIGTKRD
jgi:hypothetical protein